MVALKFKPYIRYISSLACCTKICSSLDRSVLDEVEAMRAYNEEIEHLNEVARNRPRAQLVLGKEICSFSQ